MSEKSNPVYVQVVEETVPSSPSVPATTKTVYQLSIPTKKLKEIGVTFGTQEANLPEYTAGTVVGIRVSNPPSNSGPITVNGEEVAAGSTWEWDVPGIGYSLDPASIRVNPQGQAVKVWYVVY